MLDSSLPFRVGSHFAPICLPCRRLRTRTGTGLKKKKEKEKEAGSRTTDGPPVRLCALLPLLAASRDEERCLGAKVSLSADVDAADPGARLRR